MIYVTADHHFGHENIIEYEQRPYTSVGEMNASMIDNWNRVIEPNDYVIHLGDFSLLSSEITIEICQQLQGRIILINGNHDHRTRNFWEQRAGILKWFKRPQLINDILWLTHAVDFRMDMDNPRIWTGKKDWWPVNKNIVLHGHCHGKEKERYIGGDFDCHFINVGVDAWDYTPIPLPKLLPPILVEYVKKWIITDCLLRNY